MAATERSDEAVAEHRFTRLHLKNVRCFDDTEIPLDPYMTVIIGENGAGKTTVAEAIASLCAGEDEGLTTFPLRHGKRIGHISLFDAASRTPAAIWRQGGRFPKHERLPDNRYLFAYGRYRRVYDPQAEPEATSTIMQSIPNLLDDLANSVLKRRTATLNRPDGHLRAI